MRNKYNAGFYEESKYYNTNQNNTDESNLDNNRGKKHNPISTPITDTEISSEFDDKQEDYKKTLSAGENYYDNISTNKNKKSK